jgi:ABC-type glycerol-3-phosphate transport system substrate-binding protein
MKEEERFTSKKMNRREFIKSSGKVAAGAILASAFIKPASRVFAGSEKGEEAAPEAAPEKLAKRMKVPLEDKQKFAGITLNYEYDGNWSNTIDIVKPHIEAECGVKLGNEEVVNMGEDHARIVPQLLSKSPRWDFFVSSPMFMGDFVAMDGIEPLDGYLAQYEGTEEYLDQVMPPFREFGMKRNNKVYGVMVDGDIMVMHYRPSYFNDPDLKRKFERKFKMELSYPKTWDHYLKVSQFFTEETPDGIYGTQLFITPPVWGWAPWMNIAASNGVKYFDESMNPLIASNEAVEALDMAKELLRFAPPGGESLHINESIKNWQNGTVLSSIWWIDLPEYSAQQAPQIAEDQGGGIMPGWEKNGKVVNRAIMAYGRTAMIPKNIPQKQKDAAFYFIYRMSHQDYSVHYVADEYSGTDPYMKIHYETPEEYTTPNPLRSTTDRMQTNQGIFRTVESAKRYLEMGKLNAEVGFPQMDWSGASEYSESLGRNIGKAYTGELTSKQALDKTADEWIKIVQKYGIDEQKAQYASFIATSKRMGYW